MLGVRTWLARKSIQPKGWTVRNNNTYIDDIDVESVIGGLSCQCQIHEATNHTMSSSVTLLHSASPVSKPQATQVKFCQPVSRIVMRFNNSISSLAIQSVSQHWKFYLYIVVLNAFIVHTYISIPYLFLEAPRTWTSSFEARMSEIVISWKLWYRNVFRVACRRQQSRADLGSAYKCRAMYRTPLPVFTRISTWDYPAVSSESGV